VAATRTTRAVRDRHSITFTTVTSDVVRRFSDARLGPSGASVRYCSLNDSLAYMCVGRFSATIPFKEEDYSSRGVLSR